MKSRDNSFEITLVVLCVIAAGVVVYYEFPHSPPIDGPHNYMTMGVFFSTVKQFAVDHTSMVGLIPFAELDEQVTTQLKDQCDEDRDYYEMLQMWSNKVDVWGNELEFECKPRDQGYRLTIWSPGPDRVLDHSVDNYDDMYLKLWVSDCSQTDQIQIP